MTNKKHKNKLCIGIVAAQHEQLPGQAVQLLRVAAEESVDAGVRTMAAINFKNFVKRSWEKSEHETGASMPPRGVWGPALGGHRRGCKACEGTLLGALG